MNFKKLMSLFLAVLMLCGVMTSLSVMPVAAEEVADGETSEEVEEELDSVESLYTEIYASPEEKLATMKLMTTKGNYAIYAQEASGEVAVKDLSTGQILFTNPYDIGAATASESVKNEILSQIIVKFDENGRERVYSSFEYAAMRDQIKVKNIKNGIRVEYTIGREEARRLVPRMITKERFETMIQQPMEDYYGVTFEDAKIFRNEKNHPLASASFYLCKQMSYFVYKDLEECTSDRLKQDLLDAFPIVEKFPIYVLDKAATTTEIEKIEEVIKTACPNYSYEEMDYDHQLTEYSGDEENPPVFKMALEYTLGEDGFTVRLPANGIRFNESKFQLTNVSVLPYMGAGNNTYSGYTFYPDGSGALFAFEDLVDQNTYTVASKVYGVDYAYHQISGTYQQTVRYPVFGIVENTEYYDCLHMDEETGDEIIRISSMIYDGIVDAQKEGLTNAMVTKYGDIVAESEAEKVTLDRGYVAIIEEGDALTELVTYHAGVLSPYDTVQMNFNPRPKDSYNIADAISVGTNSEWTVVSNRKYVGNYKIHYVMLSDETNAAEKNLKADDWYEASWLGMAKAYRDYLVGRGILTQLSAEQTSSDIPLYIETFGAVETVEKIMSIPVAVMKPLTSTDDIKAMYDELSDAGATNVNFKLTGYANGGIWYSTMPYKLKWEKAVAEGGTSMQDLFDFAAGEENMAIFPEFEFSYQVASKMFDGFSSRKHAVRTIDDRYTFERPYMATQQKYTSSMRLAVSPAYYDHFYTKLMENYLGYNNVTGISVGSLGDALNSDFDEDEPYNREDSKSFISKALDYISTSKENGMEVMVDGGNAYTWKYVDHILGAALDSSRYIKASYSVPFVGVVLHGYMNFAGSPLNMEGDVNYAKLKAIENGASIYFTLSYQNTQILKDDFYLSQYYSIRYDIWKEDVIEIYNELNNATKDVQNKIIVDHEFLSGMRVPDVDELDRDTDAVLEEIKDYLDNKAEYEQMRKTQAVADARDKIASVETAAEAFVKNYINYYYGTADGRAGAANSYMAAINSYADYYAAFLETKAAYEQVLKEYEAADAATKATLENAVAVADTNFRSAQGRLRSKIREVGRQLNVIQKESVVLEQLYADALEGRLLINATEGCPQSIVTEIEEQIARTNTLRNQLMGINFNFTVEKGELDTALRAHLATVIISAYGETNHSAVGIIGKAKNLYDILQNKAYGLRMDELALLKDMPENKGKTDAEIIAKYDLKENATSVSGLVTYLKELLGEGYEFDPTVSALYGGVDQHIQKYAEATLYYLISTMGEAKLVPGLNFNPNRLDEEGRLVSNSGNIKIVTGSVDAAIKEAMVIAEGATKLSDIMTEDQVNALIKKCVGIINAKVRSEANPIPADTAIEYATPDTLEADLYDYIEGKFHKQILDNLINKLNADVSDIINPQSKKPELHIRGTADQTDDTIELILNKYSAGYAAQATEKATYYQTYAAILKKELTAADAEVNAILNGMNALLDVYGDVRTDLEVVFLHTLASRKDFLKYSLADAKDIPEALREQVQDLVKTLLPTMTLQNADLVVIAPIKALYLLNGVNPAEHDANVKEYVYYSYFNYVASLETESYYYDKQLAAADIAIAKKIAETNASLAAGMAADADFYDICNVVLNALADSNNSVYDFTDDVADFIKHVPTGKYDAEDDVLAFYIYGLLTSFGKDIPATEPVLYMGMYQDKKTGEIKQDKGKYADLILALEERIVEQDYIATMVSAARANIVRGALINYSISAIEDAVDLDGIVDDLYDTLRKTKKLSQYDDETKLRAGLEDYVAHKYYMAVLKRLGVDSQPVFHVSEVYSGTLGNATNELEALLLYYSTSNTGMTEDEVRGLYNFGSALEDESEEEGETSRYLSDDGRIVSVTYGDKNADGSYSAYKTFILNYNNFAVSVEYAGVTYTIPAYGYVIVWP